MSTTSPPAGTTGTGGGKGKKVRVKKESIGEEGEKDKPYKCDICVKRYARRDYLERHLLNRMSLVTNNPLSVHFSYSDIPLTIVERDIELEERRRRGADG